LFASHAGSIAEARSFARCAISPVTVSFTVLFRPACRFCELTQNACSWRT
jgi:hypothetical protein